MNQRPRSADGRFLPAWHVTSRPWLPASDPRRTEERWIVHLARPRDDDPAPPEWLWLLAEARWLWQGIGWGVVGGLVAALAVVR